MAIQTWWEEIPLTTVTLGATNGAIVLDLTANPAPKYRVKMTLNLQHSSGLKKNYVINRIAGGTIYLGPEGEPISKRADLVAAGFGAAGTLQAFVALQKKKGPEAEEIDQYVYEQEPVNANRVYPVDDSGELMGSATNPTTVTIGGVSLAPNSFNDVKIVRDSSGNASQYQFYLNTTLVGTVDVTRDSSGNAIEYKGTLV